MNQNQERISLQGLIDLIPCRSRQIDCTGLTKSADAAFLTAKLRETQRLPLVVIAATPKAGESFIEDLLFFCPENMPVIYFPPYNILPFKLLAYHNETAAKRIRTLYQLLTSETPPIVVTTVGALLQKLIPKSALTGYAELLMAGEEIDRDALVEKLLAGSYVQSMLVEESGDFCVRGGILDIFSPRYSEPLRVELDGETIDSIRFFSPVTQRTIKKTREAIILPAREVVLKNEGIEEIYARIRSLAAIQEIPVTQMRYLIERIKKEGVFPGIESLIPLIYPRLDTLFEYVPDQSLFIQLDSAELDMAAEMFAEEITKNFAAARKANRICAEPEELFLNWKETRHTLSEKKALNLNSLGVLKSSTSQAAPHAVRLDIQDNATLSLSLKPQGGKENLFSPLAEWIADKQQSDLTTVMVCQTRARIKHLNSILRPYGIELKFIETVMEAARDQGVVYGCLGSLSSGFVWPDAFLAVLTEKEIFDAKRQRRSKAPPIDRSLLLGLEDLKKDDLVVHFEHGIGRYNGLSKLKISRATNDFLLIHYRDDDKLYVPVDRMSVVQKYMGVDGIVPVLDKMGGKSWEKIKKRVKKSAEKIAGELLKLYAARKVEKGCAFEENDDYYRDFVRGFSFEETPDQSRAVEETLDDMRQSMAMDRLVCGDVGYGKTEVALRASFVTVNHGKQTAILVPTTVLAEQHFATFQNRFERFSVRIGCLTRFRSNKEQRTIIAELKAGKLDIIIGTHRLLQKDVFFKDLGLLIIDEEQRFGVQHKEKLKKIRKTVDVLSLTATPIPRTLHMSLMGVRDISVISTPPEHRHPIITYISEFDDALIAEGVRKELSRQGQIFFVHNNIHSIEAVAGHLQSLVPEVRLAIAHGRMAEEDLEQVMLSFLKRQFDMLLCTTIIESGIDIPSANTIFINRADRFGLAQIYQLRGRVGRADEQAYAYLFIPHESHLTRDARKRLKVLMEHSDLGSGFQIAMNDLQIRGGGTILGASQSGHIAAVGYDLFLKLMEEAIAEIKGKPVLEKLEPEINIPVSAFIPEGYIPDIDQRLTAYRRLAKMTALNEIADFKSELIDRYGHLPNEAANLLLKIMLRVLSVQAGVKRLDLKGTGLILYFSEIHQKRPAAIADLIVSRAKQLRFTPDQVLKAKLSKQHPEGLLVQTKNILKEVAQHVNA